MATERKNGHGGSRPGSGRKPQEARDELARLIDKAVPLSTREAILSNLAVMALDGNIKAATLLLAYTYGRPVERQEVAGDGGGPMQIKVVYDDIEPAHHKDED